MKEIRILSTAGLGISDSNRLKTYCSLMQESLLNQWIIVDDFVESHVCFIHSDFLLNLDETFKTKSQVTVLVNKDNETNLKFDYQLKLPFTTNNVKQLLNSLSKEHVFKETVENQSPDDEKASHYNFLQSIGKSLFGDKSKINLNKARNSKTNKVITERLTAKVPESSQIVFIGSPRSGKSRAIESICQENSIKTNLYISDDLSVQIDYGELKFNSKQVNLVGLPSKIRSEAIWNILTQQASTLVILLDLSRPEPLTFLEYYLNFLSEKNNSIDVFCCFTHCDKFKGSMHKLVLKIKEQHPELTGIFHIDARIKSDIEKLLIRIIDK